MKNSMIRFALLSTAAIGTILATQSSTDNPPAPQNQAQPAPRRPMDPQKQVSHLTKKLALTTDQQNQILPILTDRQQQMASIASDTTLDQKQRHDKMVAIRNDSESRLRNVLTDTQRASYDQMQQQARDRARERKQNGTAQ